MAYAGLISLDYTQRRTGGIMWKHSAQQEVKELSWMVKSLKQVLQRLDDDTKRGVDGSVMDAKITEAAWKLEDVLQSYMLNESLESVLEQEMDLFLKTAKVLRDEYTTELEKPWPNEEEEDDDDFVRKKSTMIGLYGAYMSSPGNGKYPWLFLVTTRLEEVVGIPCRSPTIHKIRFLNDEESWDLLWRNVFLGKES